MSNIFQDILSKTSSSDVFLKSQNSSAEWFRTNIRTTAFLNTQLVINKMRDRHRDTILPGRMYLFRYDAKLKSTLPYFDKYPLVFPFRKVPDGFLGLNVHYLPYKQRAILMDALYPFISDDNNNEGSKLKITYSILSKFSKSNLATPCVKHYLNKHIKSKLALVLPNEWNTALFLPLQKFNGVSPTAVYNDSMQKIKGMT
jgi:hypothetical protein